MRERKKERDTVVSERTAAQAYGKPLCVPAYGYHNKPILAADRSIFAACCCSFICFIDEIDSEAFKTNIVKYL